MIEAVVFDLDGVLIDSEPGWEEVRRGLVARHGGHWAAGAQHRMMGMSTPEWARYLTGDLGARLTPEQAAAEAISEMAARYAEHLPLLPGAVDAVRTLAAQWPLALASSAPASLIDVVLDTSGLRGCFQVAMSTDQVRAGKPAPDIYLAVTQALRCPPGRCAAVEDSSNGLRSAAAAGLRVIAVPRPEYPPDPEALQPAALILGSLTELGPGVIRGLGA
jgi:HAD superfamily hydrolase (TIGR01509 family)